MAATIWKFDVPVGDEFEIAMPQGSEILSVGVQDGAPTLWALVDSERPTAFRRFALRGTGHDAGGLVKAMHVGSVLLLDGRLVFHLFDRGET